MPETLLLSENVDKKSKYDELLPQIENLISSESNFYANMANISAALHQCFKFHWVGFYLVDKLNDTQLVLGPFQGPIACTRIKFGKGVCGTTWEKKETIIVPDVDKFPGHIACSSLSKSEIVVPILDKQTSPTVIGVLDVDSEFYDHFDQIDKDYLNKICQILVNYSSY